MSYAENLAVFFVLLFGIIIVPGMDMLFVIANALTSGRRAGLAATAGIMLGGVFHTIWGALSVMALLHLSPQLLNVMLLAGACYMAWIGVTLLRSTIMVTAVEDATSRSALVAFRQGAVTCLLNPKAYLFTLSVYPQFLSAKFGNLYAQTLVIGIVTALMQLAVYGGLALAAHRSRALLLAHPGSTAWVGRAAGGLFLCVALLTAWHGLART